MLLNSFIWCSWIDAVQWIKIKEPHWIIWSYYFRSLINEFFIRCNSATVFCPCRIFPVGVRPTVYLLIDWTACFFYFLHHSFETIGLHISFRIFTEFNCRCFSKKDPVSDNAVSPALQNRFSFCPLELTWLNPGIDLTMGQWPYFSQGVRDLKHRLNKGFGRGG